MAGVVKSAQTTIEEHWPAHAEHTTKSRTRAPRWSTAEGIVCACGDVLGWPDPDHHETLSQYTKRTAQAQVDAAIEEGKITKGTATVKGAFGEYAAQRPSEPSTQDHPDGDLQASTSDKSRRWPGGNTDNPVDVREPGDYPEQEQQEPPKHGDDPGPEEPAELDWGDTPEDEPEPEHLEIPQGAWNDSAVRDAVRSTGVRSMREVELPTAIEDGDGEDVGTAPFPADAVPDERGNMISGGKSYGPVDFGKLADEAQAELVPWDGTGERPERWQDSDGIGWVPPESATPEEIADSGLYPVPPGEVARSEQEYEVQAELAPAEPGAPSFSGQAVVGIPAPDDDAWPEEGKRAFAEAVVRGNPSNEGIQEEEPEVGRDLVPFAGTPLMPTDPDSMDPLNRALPPLDPTLPYTPADVELKILEVLQQGERGERFLREQLARLHQAQHNLDLRYNLAIAKSDAKAADQRKAEAWIATEKERFEATQAEMLVRALRDNLHNLRAQLSGFQSVARSLGVSLTNSLDGRDMPKRIESHREPPPVAPWEYQ